MANKFTMSDDLKQTSLYYYASLHYLHSIESIRILGDESSTEKERLVALLTIYYMIRFHLFCPLIFTPEAEASDWANLNKFVINQDKTRSLMIESIIPFLIGKLDTLFNAVGPESKFIGLWEQAEMLYKNDPNEFARLIEEEFWQKPSSHMSKFTEKLEKEISNSEKRLDSIG